MQNMIKALSKETVFRIEVSLSSRKSSAIVMKTHARLYTLDKQTAALAPNPQWKSIAYGVPCIQLMRETTDHNSPFHIKVVIAEEESGISLWEAEISEHSGYNAMQTNFHTFSSNGNTFAVQFASELEGQRMLESIQDLFLQKQKAETVAFENKPDQAIFKKPKPFKRLNKKDISTPCNFKHVSGITMQRTQQCEDELRGTIQRKIRSISLSSLVNRQPNSQLENGPSPAGGRKSIRSKFGSLRVKKKGSDEVDGRRTLPTHTHKTTRPPITTATFEPSDRKSPTRSLSLSSNDLASGSFRRPPSGASLERRHTVVLDQSTRSPYHYVPYSKATGRSPTHLPQRHFSSDVHLNVVATGPVPPPPQLAHYQIPSNREKQISQYQTPRAQGDPHYQVPQGRPMRGPVPYAVVGLGSQPNVNSVSTDKKAPETYDLLEPRQEAITQRNKYHDLNLRQARSMSPLREPEDSSPSHSNTKIVPLTASRHKKEAFAVNGPQDSHSSLSDSFTDVMAKALEQFDSLLQAPQEQKQIIQTSL